MAEADEFRRAEIQRINRITPVRDQLVAALVSAWESGGEENRRGPSNDTGRPTFRELRDAGLPLNTNLPYREVANLMRTSTPRKPAPIQHVTLTLQVKPLLSSISRQERFDIDIFDGWVLSEPLNDSEYAATRTVVLKPDGGLLALPFTDRFTVRTYSGGDGLPSIRVSTGDSVISFRTKAARGIAEQLRSELRDLKAKPATVDEVDVENEYFTHRLFASMLHLYLKHFLP